MNEHLPPQGHSTSPVEARQGSRQKLNFRVLVTSLVAIAIIFAGFYALFLYAPHSENTAPPEAASPTSPATPPAPATPAP